MTWTRSPASVMSASAKGAAPATTALQVSALTRSEGAWPKTRTSPSRGGEVTEPARWIDELTTSTSRPAVTATEASGLPRQLVRRPKSVESLAISEGVPPKRLTRVEASAPTHGVTVSTLPPSMSRR
jgi:hypothetical protein